jgi:hypothetical protein
MVFQQSILIEKIAFDKCPTSVPGTSACAKDCAKHVPTTTFASTSFVATTFFPHLLFQLHLFPLHFVLIVVFKAGTKMKSNKSGDVLDRAGGDGSRRSKKSLAFCHWHDTH